MSAANTLMTTLQARLGGDATLMGLTGNRAPVDRLLDRTALPLIVWGEMETRDASTASEPGEEHLFSLAVWSDAEGRCVAEEIAARIKFLTHDAALVLPGHALVSLFHRSTRTRREPKSKRFVAEVFFRAVTEPNP